MKSSMKGLAVKAGVLVFFLYICAWAASEIKTQSPQPPQAEQVLSTPENEAAVSLQEGAAAEETGNEHLAQAGEFHLGTDPTIWILIALFILAFAVSIERMIYYHRVRGRNAKLVEKLLEGLAANSEDPKDLVEHVHSRKRYGAEGRVAGQALQGWKYGVDSIREFAQASLEAERRRLDNRLVILSTLGNNTPFIGLLGTVLGIMKAFRDLAMVGDAGPAVVMKGISEALIATAFGLAVAIPCVIAYNLFQKRIKNKLSSANEIVNLLCGIRLAFESKGSGGVQEYAQRSSAVTDASAGKDVSAVKA